MFQMRSSRMMKSLALLMGIMFLNMGFFIFELRTLELQYSKEELQDIITMVNNVGLEEEKDCSSGPNQVNEEIIDLHIIIHPDKAAAFYLLSTAEFFWDKLLLHNHCKAEIATPPPKHA